MKKGLRFSTALLASAAFTFVMPAHSPAQVRILSGEECRCVDENGEEIENCLCYRMPERGAIWGQFMPPGASRARIGITLSVSTRPDDSRGARVESVMEDGPADRAGILEGDLITHINGHSLLEPLGDRQAEEEMDLDSSIPSQRLLHLAREMEPGDEVEIRFLREGEPGTVTLVAEDLDDWGGNVRVYSGAWDPEEFGERWKEMAENWRDFEGPVFSKEGNLFRFWNPEEEGEVYFWNREDSPFSVYERSEEEGGDAFWFGPGDRRPGFAPGGWASFGDYLTACPGTEEGERVFIFGNECLGGLRLEDMNPNLGEYFGTGDGVLVADVHQDSKLGLQPGDVVLQVGDREVSGADALRRILRSYEADEEVTLHIMRQRQGMTVTGTLGR
jgi:hypothetical protein